MLLSEWDIRCASRDLIVSNDVLSEHLNLEVRVAGGGLHHIGLLIGHGYVAAMDSAHLMLKELGDHVIGWMIVGDLGAGHGHHSSDGWPMVGLTGSSPRDALHSLCEGRKLAGSSNR